MARLGRKFLNHGSRITAALLATVVFGIAAMAPVWGEPTKPTKYGRMFAVYSKSLTLSDGTRHESAGALPVIPMTMTALLQDGSWLPGGIALFHPADSAGPVYFDYLGAGVPNGQRFQIVVDGQRFTFNQLRDEEFIPLVMFVASKSNALVSLCNHPDQRTKLPEGASPVRLSAPLQDKAKGRMLVRADVMLDTALDVFLAGNGEFLKLIKASDFPGEFGGGSTITDEKNGVTIGVKDGSLILEGGSPRWVFWRRNADNSAEVNEELGRFVDANLDKIRDCDPEAFDDLVMTIKWVAVLRRANKDRVRFDAFVDQVKDVRIPNEPTPRFLTTHPRVVR